MNMDYLSVLLQTLDAYCVLIEGGHSHKAFYYQSEDCVIFRRTGGKA